MGIFGAFGIGILVLLVVLGVLFFRREMIARGGAIELSVRLSSMRGRGWSLGLGRFTGDELRWYRIFSFRTGPKRVFRRADLAVESRRTPDGQELLVLPPGSVVLRCATADTPVEIAMTESALTGFLSWLEAAPPGTASRRMAAR